MPKAAPECPSIQSLDRGITILETVARSNQPVPVEELRKLLGINRSSVFRLANTLRRRGFLTNPAGRNEFVVGPSIWRLFRNSDWNMLIGFCRYQLDTLAKKTGETAHLAVRQGQQTLFIDHRACTNQVIAVSGQTGQFKPLYCTAHGKALLADCGLEELKAIFGPEPLQAHTPQTIVELPKLAEACAGVQVHGVAFDNAEFQPEIVCVAAPIRDKDKSIVAAIGVSAPASRGTPSQITYTTKHVRDTAVQITNLLGSNL